LSKRGAPTSVSDLASHQCIVFRAADLTRKWPLRRGATAADVVVNGRINGDDMGFVRAMVVAGAGIGLLPQLNCVADEASGRLLRVLPAFQARGATLYVVYPSAKQVPARVTAFRDFVAEAFAAWSARSAS
jgi:DNA-binding transcriptional LysR family regulator